jgi:uncharacterized protein
MSETSSVSMTYPRPATRFKSLLTVAFGTFIFLGVVGLISKGLRVLMQTRIPDTLRDRAALTISGSALGELAVLILLLAYLKSRGKTLRSLGFGQSSPLRGWIISAMVTGLYVWLTLGAALRGQAHLTEASAFHAYTSLVASLSAGIVEEIFFRGFVMSELNWSGFSTTVQVLASGFLFGFAHVGWGLFGGKAQLGAALGAMITTGILGVLYAITYVASRRSLMPSIAGHGLLDLLIEPWLVLTALTGVLSQSL